ncbi:MAG TPA: hypothetical protein PL051_03230 [Candidatus Saccharibacteria bacterium]|nr:hypothetical protein [Candidatus Saccharibacteria bacterium]
MAKGSKVDPLVEKLKAENKRLKIENAKLAAIVKPKSNQSKGIGKKVSIILSMSLALVLLVLGNLVFWTGSTLTDTEKFTNTIKPVLKQPEVQKAVAHYTTSKIFANVDVESLLTEALPPRADFIAPAISAKVQDFTEETLQKAVASQQFQVFWIQTISTRHERFIEVVRNYEGNGTINLNDVYQRLSQQLVGTKLSFLANKTLPSNVGNITVLQADWLPAAHNIVKNINLHRWLTILLFFALLALSVWLSAHRRRTVITASTLIVLMMLVTLVSLRIGVVWFTGSANPVYQSAINIAVSTVIHPLVIQIWAILLLALVTVIIAWISGPHTGAVATRQRVMYLFQGKLHYSLFGRGENALSLFVAKYRDSLLWTGVVVFALIMLSISINVGTVIWSAIILVLYTFVIFALAAGNVE